MRYNKVIATIHEFKNKYYFLYIFCQKLSEDVLHQNKSVNQKINIHDHVKQDVGRRQRKTQDDALSIINDYHGQNIEDNYFKL